MFALRKIVFLLFLLVFILFLSGCDALISPQERRGYSPLPQNRPASWESSGFTGK